MFHPAHAFAGKLFQRLARDVVSRLHKIYEWLMQERLQFRLLGADAASFGIR
jgi:hypothetical protein